MCSSPIHGRLTSVKTASRTIAELCRKFGERIVGEIMIILKSKITSTDPRTREGVCLTLSEIMYASLLKEDRAVNLLTCNTGRTQQRLSAKTTRMISSQLYANPSSMKNPTSEEPQLGPLIRCKSTLERRLLTRQYLHCWRLSVSLENRLALRSKHFERSWVFEHRLSSQCLFLH
jgi:hypothetical protein